MQLIWLLWITWCSYYFNVHASLLVFFWFLSFFFYFSLLLLLWFFLMLFLLLLLLKLRLTPYFVPRDIYIYIYVCVCVCVCVWVSVCVCMCDLLNDHIHVLLIIFTHSSTIWGSLKVLCLLSIFQMLEKGT